MNSPQFSVYPLVTLKARLPSWNLQIRLWALDFDSEETLMSATVITLNAKKRSPAPPFRVRLPVGRPSGARRRGCSNGLRCWPGVARRWVCSTDGGAGRGATFQNHGLQVVSLIGMEAPASMTTVSEYR